MGICTRRQCDHLSDALINHSCNTNYQRLIWSQAIYGIGCGLGSEKTGLLRTCEAEHEKMLSHAHKKLTTSQNTERSEDTKLQSLLPLFSKQPWGMTLICLQLDVFFFIFIFGIFCSCHCMISKTIVVRHNTLLPTILIHIPLTKQ